MLLQLGCWCEEELESSALPTELLRHLMIKVMHRVFPIPSFVSLFGALDACSVRMLVQYEERSWFFVPASQLIQCTSIQGTKKKDKLVG